VEAYSTWIHLWYVSGSAGLPGLARVAGNLTCQCQPVSQTTSNLFLASG